MILKNKNEKFEDGVLEKILEDCSENVKEAVRKVIISERKRVAEEIIGMAKKDVPPRVIADVDTHYTYNDGKRDFAGSLLSQIKDKYLTP